ncbi:MAG: response regulator transcription factor [Ruminococcus sp.]|nr:response regulator transcription factor [Ruminococcus sp.]
MIVMLTYSSSKRELKAICDTGEETACVLSDEDWDFLSYSDSSLFEKFLSKNPSVDISCVDVEAKNGIAAAGRLRQSNANMYLILLTSPAVSPAAYIRPNIMAGSLLMRPLSREALKSVIYEAFREYLKKFYSDDNDDSFALNSHEGRRLIPYRSIVFFESRNKRIYLNTGSDEYSFCDTLDNLEDRLSDEFIRCHRSFIVSKYHIKKILLSKSTIETDCGYCVPLSRSYKSVVKEMNK